MEYIVKNVNRVKGTVFDVVVGDLVFGNGKKFDVTFDLKKEAVIIRRWYLIEPIFYKRLLVELKNYFHEFMEMNYPNEVINGCAG